MVQRRQPAVLLLAAVLHALLVVVVCTHSSGAMNSGVPMTLRGADMPRSRVANPRSPIFSSPDAPFTKMLSHLRSLRTTYRTRLLLLLLTWQTYTADTYMCINAILHAATSPTVQEQRQVRSAANRMLCIAVLAGTSCIKGVLPVAAAVLCLVLCLTCE